MPRHSINTQALICSITIANSIAGASAQSIDINPIAYWGGPIQDVEIVGDIAYIAQGAVLRIVNIADPANIAELSWFHVGAAASVRVRDGYAYVASHPKVFSVFNVSNPAQPTLAWSYLGGCGATGQPRCQPVDVFLRGNMAYVRGEDRLDGWNISNPLNVTYVGVVIPTVVQAASIIGDRLYAACDEQYDPSNPNANPNTGVVPPSIRVYDLAANPVAPLLLGGFYSPLIWNGSDWYDIAVTTDGHAFVTGRIAVSSQEMTAEVWVLDVSDPTNGVALRERYEFMPPGTGTTVGADIEIRGGVAYVEESIGPKRRVSIVDISDPANLVAAGAYETHGSVQGFRVIGDRLHLFDDGEGLIVTDISKPTQPNPLGNYYSPAVLRKMARVGDLLYIADSRNGFTILDISDPAHPEVAGVYLAAPWNNLRVESWGLAVKDNRVYLGAGPVGLEVVDVSNPATPTFVSAFRMPPQFTYGGMTDVVISGNTAYVGASYSGEAKLLMLNIADPLNITQLGTTAFNVVRNPPRTIELNGQGIAFLAWTNHAVHQNSAINVSNPANMFIVHAGPVGPIPDLALNGNSLYLACDSNGTGRGLHVRSVANPANPTLLGSIGPGLSLDGNGTQLMAAFSLALGDGRLYTAGRAGVPGNGDVNGKGGHAIYVFDLPGPFPVFQDRSPEFSGGGNSDGSASIDLLVNEPNVYATAANPSAGSSNGDGLIVYQVDGLPLPLCPADIAPAGNPDGTVNVGDLLAVIGAWGPCANCPADIAPAPNGNNIVNVEDLLAVIGAWGPCD